MSAHLTGLSLDAACKEAYADVRSGKTRYCSLAFGADNRSLTVAERAGALDSTWASFEAAMPANECRYAFYNLNYVSESDGVERTKFIAVLWSPTDASRRHKMMSAAFLRQVLAELTAGSGDVSMLVQAVAVDELDRSVVLEKALSRTTVR